MGTGFASKELLLDLFDHMEWADAKVWDVALKNDGARADQTLRHYLLHLHGVQRAFLDAWTGQPFNFRPNFDDTTLEREYESVQSYYPAARQWLASVDEQRLASRIVLPWTKWIEGFLKRSAGPVTLAETILQVAMHSTHHRAQANTQLRMVGAVPPAVDYIAWLWVERPRPEWPAVAG